MAEYSRLISAQDFSAGLASGLLLEVAQRRAPGVGLGNQRQQVLLLVEIGGEHERQRPLILLGDALNRISS